MKFKALCIIPHAGEIEIKPLVLCRECRYWYCGCTKGHDCPDGGYWFCADGEKNGEKVKKMADREKVIKGLECMAQKQAPTANPCKGCGYINRPSFAICVKDIASDALELLKEQEAHIVTELEASPTVDAAPVKHGRWVRLDMHKGMADHKCTSCGMEVYVPTSWGEPLYGYCPVCGAKMDLQEDDDKAK